MAQDKTGQSNGGPITIEKLDERALGRQETRQKRLTACDAGKRDNRDNLEGQHHSLRTQTWKT